MNGMAAGGEVLSGKRAGAEKTAYIAYVDVLRCLAIYLVIALHCVVGFVNNAGLYGTRTWWACSIINSFGRMGVPLFFMISGYLLLSSEKTREIGSFYKNRFLKLALPFFVWDAVYFLEGCILSGSWDILVFFQELVRQGSKYHLWFIYQIMGLYLLAPFLKKIVDHSTTGELLVFLAVVLLQPTLLRFFNVIQPVLHFAPFLALVEGYVGFFLLGYLLGTRPVPPRLRGLLYLTGVAGMIGGTLGNYLFSSPEKISFYFSEGYSIMQYMTAGALFLLAKETRFSPRVLRGAGGLAKLTFGIYFVHVLVLDVFTKLAGRLHGALTLSGQIAASIVAVSVVSTLLAYVFSRLPILRRFL